MSTQIIITTFFFYSKLCLMRPCHRFKAKFCVLLNFVSAPLSLNPFGGLCLHFKGDINVCVDGLAASSTAKVLPVVGTCVSEADDAASSAISEAAATSTDDIDETSCLLLSCDNHSALY